MLAMQDVYPSSDSLLTNEEWREHLIRKRQLIDLQELSFAQDAAAFAATDVWDEDGSVSAIDWMRFNCKIGRASCRERVLTYV